MFAEREELQHRCCTHLLLDQVTRNGARSHDVPIPSVSAMDTRDKNRKVSWKYM